MSDLFFSTRPKPFAGMLIYGSRSLRGRSVWWRLAEPDQNPRWVNTAWMLIDTEGVITTQYVETAVSKSEVSAQYRLPGEPGCPPIPDFLQHTYKDGDLYYFFSDMTKKWQNTAPLFTMDPITGAFVFDSRETYVPDFSARALYRPPNGVQVVESGVYCTCSTPNLAVTGIGPLVIRSCRNCKLEVR